MKNRTIILSLFLLLPLVPAMAQEQKEEQVLICYQEKKPSFNGGDANTFSKWVNEHKQYPEEAKEAGIQGRVYTQFTITKEGKLTNVKLLKGVHPLLDEEAIRVIESAPQNWKSGENYKGEPIDVTYTFPVLFSLPKE
ncbi:MAG: energy transducer TonB [Bacteroidales bacterium]|nr:energy transducer TonB [Bacteroidales bacterium]